LVPKNLSDFQAQYWHRRCYGW